MKVNSINCLYNYTNLNYGKILKNKYLTEKPDSFEKENEKENVSFKGWGGTIGSIVGTIAGVGIGIATGGLAAPLLIGMAGCASGAITGDVIQSKRDSNYKNDNDDEGFDNNYYP